MPSPFGGFLLEAADFDGDGDLDLVDYPRGSARTSNPGLYWFENLGNRQFSEIRLSQLVPGNIDNDFESAKLINLTGDASLECFVCRESYDPIAGSSFEAIALVPSRDGQPSTESILLSQSSNARWVTADLDLDGQGELVQVVPMESDSLTQWSFRILDRQADGTFAESVSRTFDVSTPLYSLIFEAPEIQLVDLDADDDLDLVIQGTILFERTGDRSFSSIPIILDSGSFDTGRPWVDLNEDGLPDITNGDLSWLKNLGEFSFELQPVSPASSLLFSGSPPRPIRNSFYSIRERTGAPAMIDAVIPLGDFFVQISAEFLSGEAFEVHALPKGSSSTTAGLAFLEDLDGDFVPELVAPAGGQLADGSPALIPTVFWKQPSGLVPLPLRTLYEPSPSPSAFVGDFNDDEREDLIIQTSVRGHYSLLLNHGQGGLDQPRVLTELKQSTTDPVILGSQDMNQDGFPDLIILDRSADGENAVTGVAHGRGDGTFSEPVFPSGSFAGLTQDPTCDKGVDFIDWDQDGDLDLVVAGVLRENVEGAFPNPDRRVVDLGQGSDIFGSPMTVGFTTVGDLDGDHLPDVVSTVHGEVPGFNVVGASLASRMAIAYHGGPTAPIELVEVPLALAATDMLGNIVSGTAVIVDLNADGWNDLAIRKISGYDIWGGVTTSSVWRENPADGSRNPIEWQQHDLSSSQFPSMLSGGFDADGEQEWVTATHFTKPGPTGPVVSQHHDFTDGLVVPTSLLAVLDVDQDGDSDFVVGPRSSASFTWARNLSPVLLIHNPLVDERSSITRHFLAQGIWGIDAGARSDADGDGLDNLTELAFGSNPLVADTLPSNPLNLEVTDLHLPPNPPTIGVNFVASSFAESLGVEYAVEESYDLVSWHTPTPVVVDFPAPAQKSISAHPEAGGRVLPFEKTRPSQFYRVRAFEEKE